MSKILIISGPTATGKTALAVKLAQKFNGELISADSRQIYRGMDIGTGKDHPKEIKIHLIDLITPDQSFSVAQYQSLAVAKIKEIQSRGKLPIIVGGTGQYLDSIINPNTQTFSIKPNKFLRFFLNKFSIKLLQSTLRLLDFKTFRLLNNSDLNNPRRLIRKIEIKLSLILTTNHLILNTENQNGHFDFLHLSLTAPNSYLYQRIDKRVSDRLKIGLLTEIRNLLKYYNWSDPGLNTLAYKEFKPYFEYQKENILTQCIEKWRYHEHAYARRQKTYLKKLTPKYLFEITNPRHLADIFDFVAKWYNKS